MQGPPPATSRLPDPQMLSEEWWPCWQGQEKGADGEGEVVLAGVVGVAKVGVVRVIGVGTGVGQQEHKQDGPFEQMMPWTGKSAPSC